jgi:hypothetical protein
MRTLAYGGGGGSPDNVCTHRKRGGGGECSDSAVRQVVPGEVGLWERCHLYAIVPLTV